jgi:hypothetical protein
VCEQLGDVRDGKGVVVVVVAGVLRLGVWVWVYERYARNCVQM